MTESTREFAAVRQTIPIHVKDIEIGDEFWFQGFLYWTALAHSSRTSIGWTVRVLYPDGSFGPRCWRIGEHTSITVARVSKVQP